jgi:hypothetical protein
LNWQVREVGLTDYYLSYFYRKLDMTHAQKNIIELVSFNSSITNKREHGFDGFIFEGFVTYEALSKTVTEILEVYLIISGYEPMVKLDINSRARIITSDTYHLDLNPRYDNIHFKHNNGALIINGSNSPKIGNYRVMIEVVV